VAPEAALAGLLTAAGMDARYLPGDLDRRAGLWRDRMAGQRALLVLDNAADSDQVTPLLPGGERCLVLVTSRRHLGDLPGTVVPVLLDALPPDQAREMFLRLAPRAAAQPEAVAELARLAGCLPLAISLLARVYARHPSWTLADLTAETRASLLTLAAENDSIAAAFEVSYRYLAPARQQFFRRLGLQPGITIDPYAAAALAGVPLDEAAGLLDALHGEGLLTEPGYRRYAMHDLIRRYARDLAAADPAADRDQALERLLDYYQHTAATAEVLLARQPRTGPAAATRIAPPATVPGLPDGIRALSWARTERANLLACLDHVTRAGQHARVVALTAATAALLRQDGPWPAAVIRHGAAVQAAQQLGDRLGHADALSNLAVVRRLTGDYPGAAEAQDAALGVYRSLGNRLGQANALNELGGVRRYTGDYPGAAKALEAALGIYSDLGSRGGEAEVLNELGTLHRIRGDLDQAETGHRQALDVAREIDSSWGEACALAGLGRCALAAGRTAEAQEGLRQAREIFQKIGAAEAASVAAELDALTGMGPAA
jgi:tetratricopeptide (TPR) repeat protein